MVYRDKNSHSKSIIFAALFLILVGLSAISNQISLIILPLYLIFSFITFVLYAIDKSAARKGAWRIQESTLHLFSLVGGWPGAIVAQQKLLHKSKKQSFQLMFRLTVLINSAVFIYLQTPTSSVTLQTLIKNFV